MTPQGLAAATGAYLDTLPLALRRAAEANTLAAHLMAIAMLAVVVGVCWLVLKSGALGVLRRRYSPTESPSLIAQVVCTGAFGAVLALACAPLAFYGAWRLDPGHDLVQLTREMVGRGVLMIAAAAILAPLAYGLMRLAPRRWGLVAGAGLGLAIFALTWAPFVLASGPVALPPAPAGPAREALVQLIAETHTPAKQIYISPNPQIDADVTGTPDNARVVVSQGMWTKTPPDEIRAAVGHLMGHYANGDQLSLALVLGLLALGGGLAVQGLFAPAARALGAREVQGPADPAALPVLAAVAAVYLAVAGVGFNNFIRLVNVRADQFSLDHARAPDGLARSLVRNWRGDRVDPGMAEQILFYDHPSLQSRLDHAMRWKASHPS